MAHSSGTGLLTGAQRANERGAISGNGESRVEIEEKRNVTNVGVISAETSRAAVRVMHTDEEVMIAKSVCHVLDLPIEKENEHGHEDEKA